MPLARTSLGSAKAIRPGLFAAVLFCLCALCAGCDNFCLLIVSNPGGTSGVGVSSGTAPSCPVPKPTPTGNVSLTFGFSVTTSESALVRAPHIFVTLRGIDALPASTTDDAPAWQDLAPQLAEKPAQIDLTASSAGASCTASPLGSAAVPAGVYRQLRLRLVPNAPLDPTAAAAGPPLGQSACGTDLFSCLIPPDSAPQPLAFDDPAEIAIPSDRIADGSFRVVPNSRIHLSIALDPTSSRALPEGPALRLIPAFSVSAQSCSRQD
jgi:hypothetical protein